jgi:hypothetical protein
MIFTDRPESDHLKLPSDNLSTKDRLSRLFSGIEDRWRLLAVLTLNSTPSNLIKPELLHLARTYGPHGLVVRVVFISSEDISLLERELPYWSDENIVASGDSIHARRFLDVKSDNLPCLKLFTPKGELKSVLSGFDTEKGVDTLCRILQEETDIVCQPVSDREERITSTSIDSLLTSEY